MKKFTRISLITAGALAAVGMLLLGISTLMGAGFGVIGQMARNGELNFGKWHIDAGGVYYGTDSGEDSAGTDSVTYRYEAENVRNLDVDIDAALLTFVEGTQTEQLVVSLRNGKENYFTAEMDGDTLEIEYDTGSRFSVSNGSTPEIVVEIPAGMAFVEMDLEIGAAEAVFELTDVTCETLKLDVGAGEIDAKEFTVTGKMEVDIGAGTARIDGGTYQDIRLECGMGEFIMEGTLNGNLTAKCGMGSMELWLDGTETDYNYIISCGVGDVSVNGTSYSSISVSMNRTNPDAVGTINLDCGMGSIDLWIE